MTLPPNSPASPAANPRVQKWHLSLFVKWGVIALVFAAYATYLAGRVGHVTGALVDDIVWTVRAQRSVFATGGENDYAWAVDMPGMSRFLYGITLHGLGLENLPQREPDLTKRLDDPANQALRLPRSAATSMRAVSIAAYMLGIVALFLAARLILSNDYAALLSVLPFMLCPSLSPAPPNSTTELTGTRIGPDACLLMMFGVSLTAWLYLDRRWPSWPWRSVLVMGLLGGLCVWAKWNGALMLIAFGLWIILKEPKRGALKTLFAIGVAAGMLWALTPPFWTHAPWQVVPDILARREAVSAEHALVRPAMQCSHWQVLVRSQAWLAIVAAAPLWVVRKQWWVSIVAAWGASLGAGTVLVITEMPLRYVAPWYMVILWVLPTALVAALGLAKQEGGQPLKTKGGQRL